MYRDLDGNLQPIHAGQRRKKAKPMTPSKVTKPAKSARAKPKAPVVECWRPAGGDIVLKQCKPKTEVLTESLGIARVADWRLETFTASVKSLIEQHAEIEEMTTEAVNLSGENVTDVYVTFRSELVAEMVKERIDGELFEGRKLQIKFA